MYPNCDDGTEGDEVTPRLTRNVVCNPCRKRLGKLLGWVVLDYATIKSSMPAPARRPGDGSKHVAPKAKSFGHPAEWASDRAALVADHLNELEHDLRDHLGRGAAVHPRVDEVHRVKRAYQFLTNHFDEFVLHPALPDLAEALADLHSMNRSKLGQTRFVEHLGSVPCPTCEVHALTRSVGQIECGHCYRVIEEDMYPFLVRMIIDDVIDAYDAKAAESARVADPALTL